MPFGYLRISISGPTLYGGGPVHGLDKIDSETKKGNSNVYSTRTLVNLSLVAYIKPDRGAPRGTSYTRNIRQIEHTTDYTYATPPMAAPCKYHCDHILDC
jgi:hypothetical protein